MCILIIINLTQCSEREYTNSPAVRSMRSVSSVASISVVEHSSRAESKEGESKAIDDKISMSDLEIDGESKDDGSGRDRSRHSRRRVSTSDEIELSNKFANFWDLKEANRR